MPADFIVHFERPVSAFGAEALRTAARAAAAVSLAVLAAAAAASFAARSASRWSYLAKTPLLFRCMKRP
jgi:hypothetical protein